MATAKVKVQATGDTSTEEKIKNAARTLFTRKGYAATRTRDIAEEAGINLALLNYYFRSKEKLFDLVMMENVQQLLIGIKAILYDESTTLAKKTELIVANYILLLRSQPDLPLFILHEMKANPAKLGAAIQAKTLLVKSNFYRQVNLATKGTINPVHVIMNILGLTVF